mmetsp:Transcript_31804/g.46361  ORF Transcript_31804/g.46361 Transcript_31804/m.46361 type:complete len:98 (-) Transcript_31804:1830-2123(-)
MRHIIFIISGIITFYWTLLLVTQITPGFTLFCFALVTFFLNVLERYDILMNSSNDKSPLASSSTSSIDRVNSSTSTGSVSEIRIRVSLNSKMGTSPP